MTEMVHGSMPASVREPVLPRWWRTLDKWTMAAVVALYGVGLLLGLAASVPLATRQHLPTFYYVEREAIYGMMALVVMLVLSMMPPDQIRRFGVIGFAVAFAMLMLLPIFGTSFGNGAVRWFSLGFISFQPSEFLKPGFVIISAWLMAASREINGPPGKTMSFAIAVVVALFLIAQPDFGQTILVLFAWGVIYYVAGAPMLLIGGVIGMMASGGWFFYHHSAHFARRINLFLEANIDPRSQIAYATDAIREGGFFGVGLGQGQVKWVLPDAHTDFIIAVAAEEYGQVLVVIILALFATIVVRSLSRLMKERDPFVRLAGTGLASIFGAQAMINIAVAVRLLPNKGMTLPFISYGGSSVIAAGITMGMLLALTRSRPQGELADIFRRGR